MLSGETVAVYCETEHIETLWAVRTSQETYTVWAECRVCVKAGGIIYGDHYSLN
jgi:hypothetical protein